MEQCKVACLFCFLFVLQKIVQSRLLNPFWSFDRQPSIESLPSNLKKISDLKNIFGIEKHFRNWKTFSDLKTFFGFGKQKWKWRYIRIKLYVILYIAFKKRNLSVQSTQSPFCHIITRSNENTASCFSVYDPVISDQMVVHCNLHVNRTSCPKRKIAYSTLRSINVDMLNMLIQIYFCRVVDFSSVGFGKFFLTRMRCFATGVGRIKR